MRIVMLGTGHAVVTECYNTCWVLERDDGACLLVDGGGGSGLVTQMAHAGIAWRNVHEVFVTHRHVDHILGVVWALRMLGMEALRGSLGHVVRICGNAEVIGILERMARDLLDDRGAAVLGTQIVLEAVADGQEGQLLGLPATFFELHSQRVAQLGFSLAYEPGRRLVCCGDVALRPEDAWRAQGADWLLHEAFCLSDHPAAGFISRADHSTVAQAAQTAAQVGAHNLLLYHTEDGDLPHRRARYTAEARRHFAGNVWVPDDLDAIDL